MADLRIITFNTWGAPYARDREARFSRIGEAARQFAPDIVAFQEVFSRDHYATIVQALARDLPFHHYFTSGVIGSGLATFSRYPIVDAIFQRFRLSGKPEKVRHGDYYAGKGIGLTRINAPSGIIDFYNTHTHAQYVPAADNEYAAVNASNLYEAARFITAHSSTRPAILCGDLNSEPHQLGYRIVTCLAQMHDSYTLLHPGKPGYTFLASNPYTREHNQRLDYILTRGSHSQRWVVSSISPALNEISNKSEGMLALSDHCAVIAEVQLLECDEPQPQYKTAFIVGQEPRALLAELATLIDREIELSTSSQNIYTDRAVLSFASIADSFFLGTRLLQVLRIHGSVRNRIRTVLMLFGAAYGLFALAQAQINLRGRLSVLEALRQELHWQAEAQSTQSS